jgi:hypothetical protein
MTSLIKRVLQRLINPEPFDENDVMNAEVEDKQREHHSLVQEIGKIMVRREELNDKLRESIKIAREQTSSFADFERLTGRRREQGND